MIDLPPQPREATVARLRREDPFFVRYCKQFIQDLYTTKTISGALARLEGTRHEYFLGPPYFTEFQRGIILAIEVRIDITVKMKLEELFKEKTATGKEVCPAHDLGPIFQDALGVYWNEMEGKAEVFSLPMVVDGTNRDGASGRSMDRRL